MFDFNEKRKIRGLLYSKGVIAILLLCTGLLSMSVFERFRVEREMAAKREERAVTLEEHRQRAAALESRVERIQDDRGIEAELRNKFDAVREGEQVIVIVDDTEDAAAKIAPTSVPEEDDANGWSIWDVFKFW